MSKKPVIGIILDLTENSERYQYSSCSWYALRQHYASSVTRAGGVPILLPYQPTVLEETLDLIDGLVIPGSDKDINPKFYHQSINSKHIRVNYDDEKTNFEFAILEKALARNIPFLGICHGIQLLNIFSGGDIIQHIPDFISTAINHKQIGANKQLSHNVDIVSTTLLSTLTNKQNIIVNSSHHQAVGKLGTGLVISAIAPDGVIEAIESTHHKFVLGIQWHPEYLNDNGLDLAIFEGLIKAAKD